VEYQDRLTSQITQFSKGSSAGWSNSVPHATHMRLSWSVGVRVVVVLLAMFSSDFERWRVLGVWWHLDVRFVTEIELLRETDL
jgi:hypothetical protein